MLRSYPELGSDEVYQKYQKRVQKRLGSTKRVESDLLKGKPLEASSGSRGSATWVSAAVLTAIV